MAHFFRWRKHRYPGILKSEPMSTMCMQTILELIRFHVGSVLLLLMFLILFNFSFTPKLQLSTVFYMIQCLSTQSKWSHDIVAHMGQLIGEEKGVMGVSGGGFQNWIASSGSQNTSSCTIFPRWNDPGESLLVTTQHVAQPVHTWVSPREQIIPLGHFRMGKWCIGGRLKYHFSVHCGPDLKWICPEARNSQLMSASWTKRHLQKNKLSN